MLYKLFNPKGLNIKFKYKILKEEKLYLFLLSLLVIISLFIKIPTDTTPVGISSEVLGIGDRIFYINDSAKGFGYEEYSGNTFYPYVLKTITFISKVFGQNEFSKLWNFLTIFVTSILSIFSLRLIRLSSEFLFNENVAKISCLIYIINPYTFFYSLSGGITNYLIFGVSSIIFIFSNAYKKGYKLSKSKSLAEISLVTLLSVYLSALRPSGAIFGGLILIFLLAGNLKILIHSKDSILINYAITFLILFGLFLVFFNLSTTNLYIEDNLKLFSEEEGYFFGYSRDLLRAKLSLLNTNIIDKLKLFFYTILWKSTEFISGLSDIRDTHSAHGIENLMPFLIRTFTGIFILFPINLLSFLGLLFNKRFILKSESWIFIIASLIALSPSIMGISLSRYLIMFYSPFIIFSAKMIRSMIEGSRVDNNY